MRDKPADSSVEALDHAVGLRVAWWSEPVLDVELGPASRSIAISSQRLGVKAASIWPISPKLTPTYDGVGSPR